MSQRFEVQSDVGYSWVGRTLQNVKLEASTWRIPRIEQGRTPYPGGAA